MLKRLFIAAVAAIITLTISTPSVAHDLPPQPAVTDPVTGGEPVVDDPNQDHVMPVLGDDWVPWPWALAQPIPWADIQGVWKVKKDDFSSYFAFRVVKIKATGLRQLQIKQYDGETCRVIATGVGLERNSKILAQMTSRGGVTYRVQLTAFNEKDAPNPPLRGTFPLEAVMVLSMGMLDAAGPEDMVHMETVKISTLLNQRTCMEDKK